MKSSAENIPDGPGIKFDQEKLKWDLLPFRPIEGIVKVLTFGAGKYGPWNWIKVENWRDRYFAAAMRHLVAYRTGEQLNDNESGLSHLSHALCCLVFLAEMELRMGAEDVEP